MLTYEIQKKAAYIMKKKIVSLMKAQKEVELEKNV